MAGLSWEIRTTEGQRGRGGGMAATQGRRGTCLGGWSRTGRHQANEGLRLRVRLSSWQPTGPVGSAGESSSQIIAGAGSSTQGPGSEPSIGQGPGAPEQQQNSSASGCGLQQAGETRPRNDRPRQTRSSP